MGVERVVARGGNIAARFTCEGCGLVAEAPIAGCRKVGNKRVLDPGNVSKKMNSIGWGIVRKKLLCEDCLAAAAESRKYESLEKMDGKMTAKVEVAAPRVMSKEQEVDIIVALSSAYDRKKKRYLGNETDRSISGLVGGGCMPGWVALIREEKFGPAANEEADALREEVKALSKDFVDACAKLREDFALRQNALLLRLDQLYKAADKRVS